MYNIIVRRLILAGHALIRSKEKLLLSTCKYFTMKKEH